MILDSSALVAIICREPGHADLLRKIAAASSILVGAPTVAETQMVVTMKVSEGHQDTDGAGLVDQFLSEIQARIVPFTREHVSIFFDAFRRYGKGRHPAHLNMGDCFTYATAKAAGMPLLFVGDDFSLTDLRPA